MLYRRLSFLAITLVLATFLAGCGGSLSSPSVSVTASASTVDGTNAITLTATVTNDQNNAGVTWSVSGGGTLSSETTSSATYTAPAATSSAQTITVTATSIASTAKTGTATITVPAAPSITTIGANLAGTVGSPYTVTLAGSGGISPYHWTLSSGTLPACLTMTSAGVISGTVLASCAGVYTPTFTMTDSGTPTALRATTQLSMVIAAATPISFTGIVPITGTYNVAYSGSAAATGGAGTLTYALTSGSTLPTGVTLNTATGAISGTPTVTGTFSFAVTVSDAYGDSATCATYSLVISYPVMQITTGTLPAGYVGTAYTSTALAATGGAGVSSNYSWAVASGSALPTGLALTSSGAIIGTPSGPAGTTSVTFTVTDSTSGLSANATLSIELKAALAITAATLPTGYVGSAYTSTQLAATGGSGTYSTWALVSGSSLPTGLSLSTTGLISGTPSGLPGTGNFSVRVTDSASNTATANFSIQIVEGVTITTSTSLADGYPNTAYSPVTLTATGGTGTYSSWTVMSGSVPTGMALSTAGVLSGTPTTPGNSSFTVKVTDSAGNTATADFALTVEATLSISTTTLPSAATGNAYSQALAATGGSGGYNWTVSNSATNTLSTYNLSLSSSGQVSGTPSTTGTAEFTGVVTDSAGHTASQAFSIVISNMTIGTSTLTYGAVGSAYSQTLTASGGSGSYTWTVTSGANNLTALGLTLTSGGVLTSNGISLTTAGSASFSVQVKDSNNVTATASYTVSVYEALAFSTTSLSSAIYNTNYSAMIQTSGGSGSYTWMVNGASIPSTATATALTSGGGLTGLSSGSAALAIGGIPSSYGTITLAVQITDAVTGLSASKTYTITVASLNVSIDANSVPQGMVNMPYTFGNINVQNGTGPFTITYTNAPDGLAGNSSGQLVGKPTSAGTTTVTVTVTDSSTPTHQIGTATFSLPVIVQTVGTDNSKLNGQYVCSLDRYWADGVTGGDGTSTLHRGGAIFAFIANGGGTITGGEIDGNSPKSGYSTSSALTGTYAIGADNRGYINIGSGSLLLSAAGSNLSSNVFRDLALTEMDNAGSSPSGISGGGHCYKQVTTALSGIRPSGGYVFGMRGEDMAGNTEAAAGQIVFSGATATGTQDSVDNTTVSTGETFTNSTTLTDSFGRMTISNSGVEQAVIYLTNNSKGDTLIMTMPNHSGSNNANFMMGQARAQSSTNIAASHPINNNAVMYLNGPVNVSGASPSYKAMAMQLTGSSSNQKVTVNSIMKNNAGTFSLDADSVYGNSISYTTNTSTGRTILSGTTGDFIYLYDTNAAVVLFADTGSGGGTHNLLGWMEPQTTSGSWSLIDVATSSAMYKQMNGDYSSGVSDGVLTTASDGTISNFAQDNGGNNWASWGEGLSGTSSVTATGALALNATDGANYGLFDINMTVGGTTSTQVECYAISLDAAINSATKAKLVCLDRSSSDASLSIVQE
jgi:large repetitive protein